VTVALQTQIFLRSTTCIDIGVLLEILGRQAKVEPEKYPCDFPCLGFQSNHSSIYGQLLMLIYKKQDNAKVRLR
jgi:hypothetical protein